MGAVASGLVGGELLGRHGAASGSGRGEEQDGEAAWGASDR